MDRPRVFPTAFKEMAPKPAFSKKRPPPLTPDMFDAIRSYIRDVAQKSFSQRASLAMKMKNFRLSF